MHKLIAVGLSSAAMAVATAQAQEHEEPRPELGTVSWGRDFDQALATAKQTSKPVFLLFQEIPGCATCTGFGKNVLSHPLLKEAIEDSFVPVVVRNNVKGTEDQIRQRYQEPSWNNPVVRFVDGDGNDLLPRKDGVWDPHGIAQRMVATLEKAKRPLPGYLQIAMHESAPKTARAAFEMHCYWEGEAHLGALDGVVKTTSGWVGKAEAVLVVYRPDVISKAKLTAAAQAKSCKPVGIGKTLRTAKASDQQHSLGGTPFAKLDLTPMQRTKVHAALHHKQDPLTWLSPAQRAALPKK